MEKKGFFGALFDFSFRYFVTLRIIPMRIIPILYGLSLALGVIVHLGWLMITLDFSYRMEAPGLGIFAFFILIPLSFLIYAICVRVSFEMVAASFRVEENTRQLVELSKSQSPSSPPPPTHI